VIRVPVQEVAMMAMMAIKQDYRKLNDIEDLDYVSWVQIVCERARVKGVLVHYFQWSMLKTEFLQRPKEWQRMGLDGASLIPFAYSSQFV
jgi:hypothetical protein